MITLGLDYFVQFPGDFESMSCRVCNSECIVARNNITNTNYPALIKFNGKPMDAFICPYTEEDWHIEAVKIFLQIERGENYLDGFRFALQGKIRANVKIEPSSASSKNLPQEK